MQFKMITAGMAALAFTTSLDLLGLFLFRDQISPGVMGQMVWMALGFAALGILVATALTIRIFHPFHALIQSAGLIAKGNLKIQATPCGNDEIGSLARLFNQMANNLRRKEDSHLQLAGKVINAQEEERARIARELHDQTGQVLTSLILGLNGLEAQFEKCGNIKAIIDLKGLENLVSQAMEEVHQIAVELHPTVLAELGLFPAIRRQLGIFQKRCSAAIDFQLVGFEENERLPCEIEITLYRIFQEATLNAIRHGKAESIILLIQRHQDEVVAIIEDDGVGFDVTRWRNHGIQERHLGLFTMEERANLIGGTFDAESGEGRVGTAIFVRLPLPSNRLATPNRNNGIACPTFSHSLNRWSP